MPKKKVFKKNVRAFKIKKKIIKKPVKKIKKATKAKTKAIVKKVVEKTQKATKTVVKKTVKKLLKKKVKKTRLKLSTKKVVKKEKITKKKAIKKGTVSSRKRSSKKVIVTVVEEKYFWVNNGPVLKDLRDLYNALKTINKDQFIYHARGDNNDFALWVEYVLLDKECAKVLIKAKTQKAAVKKISEVLKKNK